MYGVLQNENNNNDDDDVGDDGDGDEKTNWTLTTKTTDWHLDCTICKATNTV